MAHAHSDAPDPEPAPTPARSHARTSALHRALLTGHLGTVGSRLTERKGKDAGA
jgi:hypothetical protein